jgi:predicted nucleic acid-binding protein
VAALAAWHAGHESARRVAVDASIPAHARLEIYSVLTRIAPPHRIEPEVMVEVLRRWFPARATLSPSASLARSIVEQCSEAGVSGGAVYDALVALTASEAGAKLVTRDERAARTYGRLGIDFELSR